MSILETPMALCSCGGRFRFDAQYLMDARRFGVALHTPTPPWLLWNHDVVFAWALALLGAEWILRKRKHLL